MHQMAMKHDGQNKIAILYSCLFPKSLAIRRLIPKNHVCNGNGVRLPDHKTYLEFDNLGRKAVGLARAPNLKVLDLGFRR